MAKKTAKTAQSKIQVVEGSAGKGKKFCPNCQKILAAAARKCECGWVATPKAKKTGKRVKKAETPAVNIGLKIDEIQQAIGLIEKLGGVDEAKKKIAVVKELLG